MINKIIIKIIEVYQRTLSPDYGWFRGNYPGGYCKYNPTCSEYCKHSIIKYGVLKGLVKGAYRLLRCNPWSKGGHDPA